MVVAGLLPSKKQLPDTVKEYEEAKELLLTGMVACTCVVLVLPLEIVQAAN
jgi:hypothetical protein